MTRERKIVLGARIYGMMLKLYPCEFRKEYGAAMLQAFRDECREATRRLWLVWARSLCDLLVNACAERLEQIMTRRWWLRAAGLTGSVIAYFASWLGLVIAMVIITYFMLVPWDEGIAPQGTFAAAVNDFFESAFILLPLFIITTCEIIAISRLTRRRAFSFARIYMHFTAVNIAVIMIGLAVTQGSKLVLSWIFPSPNPPVFEPGYGFSVDATYGTAVVYTGLIVVGGIIAFFVRLAWRTKDDLPLARGRGDGGTITQ